MSAAPNLASMPEPWASVDDMAKHLGIRKETFYRAREAGPTRLRVLRKKNVRAEDFEPFREKFMAQSEALYSEWQTAA